VGKYGLINIKLGKIPKKLKSPSQQEELFYDRCSFLPENIAVRAE
jgi:hypothetical protein